MSQPSKVIPRNAVFDGPDIDPMLCPPFVLGFSLGTKKWCRFFVTQIKPPQWVPDAFDHLVLPTDQKRIIRSLIDSHAFPGRARDTVQLKGKGLVILLHGTPGSGKTLTAGKHHSPDPLDE
jgi:hypothetical protein